MVSGSNVDFIKRNTTPRDVLNCRGKIVSLEKAQIVGILNVTPDSFSDGGLYNTETAALKRVEQMLQEGAAIIDVGGYSSKPGAEDITVEEELTRLTHIVKKIIKSFPEAILSIDTFRAEVADAMLQLGAHIVNDIGAGKLSANILQTAAKYGAPYILMHMQGTPKTMQANPTYENVLDEVCAFFVERINAAQRAGIKDIILDPGFGFGKTVEHNFELFRNLVAFTDFGYPVMIGISRKSMLSKSLHLPHTQLLSATQALHFEALRLGAKLLRVHDVAEAVQVRDIFYHLYPS